MGCGCGGAKKQPQMVGGAPVNYTPARTVTAVTQQRCPGCSWPMRKFNHYDHKLKNFVNTWVCSNSTFSGFSG